MPAHTTCTRNIRSIRVSLNKTSSRPHVLGKTLQEHSVKSRFLRALPVRRRMNSQSPVVFVTYIRAPKQSTTCCCCCCCCCSMTSSTHPLTRECAARVKSCRSGWVAFCVHRFFCAPVGSDSRAPLLIFTFLVLASTGVTCCALRNVNTTHCVRFNTPPCG